MALYSLWRENYLKIGPTPVTYVVFKASGIEQTFCVEKQFFFQVPSTMTLLNAYDLCTNLIENLILSKLV